MKLGFSARKIVDRYLPQPKEKRTMSLLQLAGSCIEATKNFILMSNKSEKLQLKEVAKRSKFLSYK